MFFLYVFVYKTCILIYEKSYASFGEPLNRNKQHRSGFLRFCFIGFATSSTSSPSTSH